MESQDYGNNARNIMAERNFLHIKLLLVVYIWFQVDSMSENEVRGSADFPGGVVFTIRSCRRDKQFLMTLQRMIGNCKRRW